MYIKLTGRWNEAIRSEIDILKKIQINLPGVSDSKKHLFIKISESIISALK